jgi:hypothetical protein
MKYETFYQVTYWRVLGDALSLDYTSQYLDNEEDEFLDAIALAKIKEGASRHRYASAALCANTTPIFRRRSVRCKPLPIGSMRMSGGARDEK